MSIKVESKIDKGGGTREVDPPDGGDAAEQETATTELDDTLDCVEGNKTRRRPNWARIIAFYLLPSLVLVLAIGAAYTRWTAASAGETATAQIESVAAAKDGAIAILSYKPDTVEHDLDSARSRLGPPFLDTYTSLIHDVVIPGAKQKHITAVASVPGAASVSATPLHAVVLVSVDQTTTVGNDPPTDTASSVRVTLDKSSGQWLITAFDPI